MICGSRWIGCVVCDDDANGAMTMRAASVALPEKDPAVGGPMYGYGCCVVGCVAGGVVVGGGPSCGMYC